MRCLPSNPVCVAVVDVDETLIETTELVKILDDAKRNSLENINNMLLSSYMNDDLLDILESGKFTDIVILSNNSSDWYVNEVANRIRLPHQCKLWVASANHPSRRRVTYTLPDGTVCSDLVKDMNTVCSILGRTVMPESIIFFDDINHVLSLELKQNNLNRQFIKIRIKHPLFQKLQTHPHVKNAIHWIDESTVEESFRHVLGYTNSEARRATKKLMCKNVRTFSQSDTKQFYLPRSRVMREFSSLCSALKIPFTNTKIASFLHNGLSSKVASAFEGKVSRMCDLYVSPSNF